MEGSEEAGAAAHAAGRDGVPMQTSLSPGPQPRVQNGVRSGSLTTAKPNFSHCHVRSGCANSDLRSTVTRILPANGSHPRSRARARQKHCPQHLPTLQQFIAQGVSKRQALCAQHPLWDVSSTKLPSHSFIPCKCFAPLLSCSTEPRGVIACCRKELLSSALKPPAATSSEAISHLHWRWTLNRHPPSP